MLSVDRLKTYFHRDGRFVRAVDDVSFGVPARATVGVAGESGSGKTQMLLSIMGLVDGTPGIVGGTVRIEGVDVTEALSEYCTVTVQNGALRIEKDVAKWRRAQEAALRPVRGRSLSLVLQEPKTALAPYLTVGGHLRETVQARFGEAAADRFEDRARPLLARMQFSRPDTILDAYPHELSGGESQRVMIALALITEPKLLLADEPTTLLDAPVQYAVLELLQSVIDEFQLALLLVTHNLGILARMVDHILVMFAGKIVEQGPTETIIDAGPGPRHPYTRLLLDAARGLLLDAEPPVSAPLQTTGCRYAHRCPLKPTLPDAVQHRCHETHPPAFDVTPDHALACWAFEP